MGRRTDRIGRLIQQTVGQIILERLSDPRIDPATVSVTRVEVADDLASAKVYCSVIGEPAQERTALRALQHAAGRIQELMMRQITLRSTPVLQFVADEQFKKSLTTLALIQEAMEEIRQAEQASDERADEQADETSADGDPVLAVDPLGAGRGQIVVITNDGGAARQLVGDNRTPARWSVIGIRDE